MNADEAKKCLSVARAAIEKQMWDKAEKWLTKSIRLHETSEAQGLLQRLDQIKKKAADEKKAAPPPRKVAEEKEPPKEFSAKEVNDAKEILRCKDYYKLLGVEKDATSAQLKKGYHRKALLVHPDKNNAPQADEAFKKVNAAMACLNDKDKRRVYDQIRDIDKFENKESNSGGGGGGGCCNPGGFQRQQYRRHGANQRDFESPEDFFNFMFFGHEPQMRRQQPAQQQQQRQQRHHQAPQGEGQLLFQQMAPLMLIMIFVLFSSILSAGFHETGGAAYPYALQRTNQFRQEMITERLNQVYFVSSYTYRDF